MSIDIEALQKLLLATLDPVQPRAAEQALKAEENKPGFCLALLQIIVANPVNLNIALAAALFLKNFIRRNWTDENGNHLLPADEIVTIKRELVGLLGTVKSRPIQSQVANVIATIAESDFWERWDTLVDDLVARLTADNPTVNNSVLQVAHSIFRRWEPLYQSDELYTEINHVLSKFAVPLLQVWQNTDQAITQHQNNKKKLEAYMWNLETILELVYDLSTHDMPPQFEENLAHIVGLLHKYLTYQNPLLVDEDDSGDYGCLERVRTAVLQILIQYTKKYEEDFRPHLSQFIGTSWNLLTALGLEEKYDPPIGKALEFLTTVASIRQHAEQFNSPEVLGQITEKVVIPNLTMRDGDVDLIDEDPLVYIRGDLEGVDDDTRQRGATSFLRTLMEQFEKPVTDVVTRYVEHFLDDYAKNKAENWKSKDVAVHLFSSIAAKGRSTQAKGVLSLNPNLNVIDFFQKHIAEDLTNDSSHRVLKTDAIRYLFLFRSVLPADQWQAAFPLLVQHLISGRTVVFTYAAVAVDRALTLTNDQKQPIIPREVTVSLSKDLLQHLFKLITRDPKSYKVQENEFLMKCLMRVLIVIRASVVDILDMVLANLVNITKVIRHNPSNPSFCYYHFESLGALIRFAGPTQSDNLDASLFPVFGEILQGGVDEFTPYVFQLFAAMVAASPTQTLSPNFQQLLQGILVPTMWEKKGDVPALNRLLCNLVEKGGAQIAAAGQTEAILIVFQKLVSSKAYELYAFELIESVVRSFPPAALENFWVSILQLMFTRLSSSKTEKFQLAFVRFYHLVSALTDKCLGADFFISVADRVQENVFTPVYLNVILPDTQKLAAPSHRKTAVISLTRTLADSQMFAERYAKKGWTLTCQALLKLLIDPPLPAATDDTIEDRDTDDLGFGAAFTPLNTCKRPPTDPWPEVQDVRLWVGTTLREADQRHSGRVGRFVGEKLDDQERQALQQVMAA